MSRPRWRLCWPKKCVYRVAEPGTRVVLNRYDDCRFPIGIAAVLDDRCFSVVWMEFRR